MRKSLVTTMAALSAAAWTPVTAQVIEPEPVIVPEPVCELHVWPTENFAGSDTGLLSSFGLVGALIDQGAHKGHVQTVKERMRDYIGPDIQLAELNRAGLLQSLGLPASYRVVIEPPTGSTEDAKTDPALKARLAETQRTFKAGHRLSASQSPCYAELITTVITYQKATLYGSNLFTNWTFRHFGDKPIAQRVANGQVKNPLEAFPPKTPDQIDAAKAELRDAYAKDYAEWVAKKYSGTAGALAAR